MVTLMKRVVLSYGKYLQGKGFFFNKPISGDLISSRDAC